MRSGCARCSRCYHLLQIEPEAPRAPAPGLTDLPAIFDLMESSGLVLHHRIADLGSVDQDLELALVRIIQESLANILRHRGPGHCWVDLERSGSRVVLTIDDDEPAVDDRQVGVDSTATSGHSSSDRLPRTGGSGLIGMRERARASRGELIVGDSPRGGFRVRAVLDTAHRP